MNHPIITFKPRFAPLLPPQTARGALVGDYLVVSYAETLRDREPPYSIYNTQGRRIFNVAYADFDSAIRMAEWLDEIFGQFFPIWESYPEADVFALARWSVDNGVDIYEVLKPELMK